MGKMTQQRKYTIEKAELLQMIQAAMDVALPPDARVSTKCVEPKETYEDSPSRWDSMEFHYWEDEEVSDG